MLGSKTQVIETALEGFFGYGYKYYAIKVPDAQVFPDSVRHFDSEGLNFLNKATSELRATNGNAEGIVTIEYTKCANCNRIYYKVIDFKWVFEYQPTLKGQQEIAGYPAQQ